MPYINWATIVKLNIRKKYDLELILFHHILLTFAMLIMSLFTIARILHILLWSEDISLITNLRNQIETAR